MSTWADEYLRMVTDCENRESMLSDWESMLSDWEQGFIDSIKHQLESERALSVKQIETLDTIWEKATARGMRS